MESLVPVSVGLYEQLVLDNLVDFANPLLAEYPLQIFVHRIANLGYDGLMSIPLSLSKSSVQSVPIATFPGPFLPSILLLRIFAFSLFTPQ